MIIHPELRALRGDDAPQRDAQELLYRAMADWRKEPQVAAVISDLAALAAGSSLANCAALAPLFAPDDGSALQLARGFCAVTARALYAAPLGHVPLRHFTDGISSTLLLARSGDVTLTLAAIEPEPAAARRTPTSVSFGPQECWDHVLAGTARGEMVECRPCGPRSAELLRRDQPLQPGTVVHRDGAHEACLIGEVTASLVALRLQRTRADAGPTREYDLATGALVHQAAANPRDSRIELMLALLGRMGHSDAAPLMGEIAREDGSQALRWQALRECLALDSGEGFRVLVGIAATPGDPLAGPAGALRSQLLGSHPELGVLEPCPA